MVRASFVAPWLCFATLLACCVPGTLGWWRGGHMLTAQVAVTRLTPEALHACQLLLGETRHIEPHLLALPEASKLPLNATTIVEAAYWPDAIRPLGFYVFAPWHYIDIPLVRDEDGANITPPPVPTTNNVVWAIEQGVRVLRTVDASAAQKSAALRFVLHFVGDVHQPLHAASLYSAMFPNGDYGGNSFHLTGSSHWSNLHSLWDSAANEWGWFDVRYQPVDPTILASVAANLSSTYPTHPEYQAGEFNITRWAYESHKLAADVGYTDVVPGGTASAAYVARAQHTCNERVVLGGWRLADLLNHVFAAPHPPPYHTAFPPFLIVALALLVGVALCGVAAWKFPDKFTMCGLTTLCFRSAPSGMGYRRGLIGDNGHHDAEAAGGNAPGLELQLRPLATVHEAQPASPHATATAVAAGIAEPPTPLHGAANEVAGCASATDPATVAVAVTPAEEGL